MWEVQSTECKNEYSVGLPNIGTEGMHKRDFFSGTIKRH